MPKTLDTLYSSKVIGELISTYLSYQLLLCFNFTLEELRIFLGLDNILTSAVILPFSVYPSLKERPVSPNPPVGSQLPMASQQASQQGSGQQGQSQPSQSSTQPTQVSAQSSVQQGAQQNATSSGAALPSPAPSTGSPITNVSSNGGVGVSTGNQQQQMMSNQNVFRPNQQNPSLGVSISRLN